MFLIALEDDSTRLEYPEFEEGTLKFRSFMGIPEHEEIPGDFFDWDNPWNRWVSGFFYDGCALKNWKFETSVDAPCGEVVGVVRKVLIKRDIEHGYKIALAGWCLASWFRCIEAVDGSVTIGG